MAPNQRPTVDYSMKAAGKPSYLKGMTEATPVAETPVPSPAKPQASIYQPEMQQPSAGAGTRITSFQQSRRNPGTFPIRRLQLNAYDEKRRQEAAPSRDPGFCVDELCSCGMHKCAPSMKPLPFDANSLYRSEFGAKPLQPPQPATEVKLPPSLPFDGKSSYRTDFNSKALPPPMPGTAVKLPPTLPFTADSSYRSEFTNKPLPPPQAQSEVKLPPSLPFDAASSYRNDFNAKPLPPPAAASEVKLPPSLPFGGTTNYRSDYDQKPLPPPLQPSTVKLPPNLPFNGNTHYREDYVRKENPVCQVSLMPPVPPAPFPSNHVFWDKNVLKWY